MREILLVIHFVGLVMGMGTGLAFAFLGKKAASMEDRQAALQFTKNTFTLSKMGHIGLALLILSGLGLIHPHADLLMSHPLLWTKLGLVILLIVLIILMSNWMKKVQAGEATTYLPKMAMLGRILIIVNLSIISLAVAVFH
jgi:uncharacterized membrane protein